MYFKIFKNKIYIRYVVLEIEKIIRGEINNIVLFEYSYGMIIEFFFFFVMYLIFFDNFEKLYFEENIFIDSCYFCVFFCIW